MKRMTKDVNKRKRSLLQSEEDIKSEIYVELRSIIRQIKQLKRPLSSFTELKLMEQEGRPKYRVNFDTTPPKKINGLVVKVKQMEIPDEDITDQVFNLAKSIWHLKDRLKLWTQQCQLDYNIEKYANEQKMLLVCADLANYKKHGANKNRSKVNPKINTEVIFNTCSSGAVEFYYNGARKIKELRVSNPSPIYYRVEIFDGKNNIITENGFKYLEQAFVLWKPVFEEIGLLSSDDAEARELRKDIFD
jgi:hypothetical protein